MDLSFSEKLVTIADFYVPKKVFWIGLSGMFRGRLFYLAQRVLGLDCQANIGRAVELSRKAWVQCMSQNALDFLYILSEQ